MTVPPTLRVGLIDIDTTHPWAIANYVNATGRARVVAITDQGATWPRSHVEEFARRLGSARVFDDAKEFFDEVDAVLLCGTRYDRRLEQTIPWLEAGKTVYLDKPAVGTLADVRVLERYVRGGARILCGSSLVWCSELEAIWRHVSTGTPAGLVVFGWRSLFEYGLHGTDIGLNLLSARPRRVRWGAFGPTECAWAELEDGQELAVHIGLERGPWVVTALTSAGALTVHLDIGLGRGSHYQGLANAFVELASTGRTQIPPEWHLEGIKLLIAAKRSRDENRVVEISELGDGDGFDGREYAAHYRALAQRAGPEGYLSPSLEELLANRKGTGAGATRGRGELMRLGARVTRRLLGDRGVQHVKSAARRTLGERGVRRVKRILKPD